MKKVFTICAALLIAGSAWANSWKTFVIRENSTEGAPVIQSNDTFVAGATEFLIGYNSQKAGWGTDISAATIGDLAAISIDRLDNTTRFTAGSGPAVAPYFNIWITNGAGSYAVVANEPSNPEWSNGNQWDMTWADLSTKTAKIYESKGAAGADWVYIILGKSSGITFGDLAGFAIEAPDVAFVALNYPAGAGTPRELGTSVAYDFNWVFGDTLDSYVSGSTLGFVVANPTVVPEPATVALLGLGGLLLRRKRNA